jgi:rhodanese-related sulfurtransferase
MRKFFGVLLLALLALTVLPVAAQADAVVERLEAYNSEIPPYGVISAEDLGLALIERDIVLLDVREIAEYEESHIDGAFNVPIRTLGQNLALLPDQDAEIVVICAGGARAMLATASLRFVGYTNVATLKGGMGGWNGEGFATTTEPTIVEPTEAPAFDAELVAAMDAVISTLPEGFGLVRADALNTELIENPDIILIDTRSPDEWAQGYIGGTDFIWINEFMANVENLPEDKDATIVVYCGSSYRAGIAKIMMDLLGYTNVRNLVGGIGGWISADLPLEGVPEEAAVEADPVMDRLVEYNSEIPPYGVISAEDLGLALIERDIVLLDVREIPEYEEGHISGAFNVPIRTLGQNLALLPDQDAEIVVICAGGARAMLATAALRFVGYTNVATLKGGMGGWNGEGFETTTEPFVVEPTEAPAFDAEVVAAMDAVISTLPEGFGLVRADALNTELIENPDIVLIDTRSPDEWATGYIAGAEFSWIDEFMANVDMLPEDKDATIVVYCGSSYRAGIAKIMMDLMGYTNVRNLVGGIGGWVAAGLPLEGAPEETAVEGEFDLAGYMGEYVASLPGSFNAIRVGDLEEALAGEEDPILVDVRTVDEYTEGHLEGAINIPLQELTANLSYLPDTEAEIVVYCGSGHRSALAMTALNMLGYDNALSLLGGVRAWTGAELPVTDVVTTAEEGMAPEFNPVVFEAVDAYMTAIPAGYFIVRTDDLNTELIESEVVLLDVRTPGEYEAGFIGGSINVPLSEMFNVVDAWPAPDANVVVYDNPTHRSTMAMMMLQMLGYENVRTLGGGFGAWQGAELPVETP